MDFTGTRTNYLSILWVIPVLRYTCIWVFLSVPMYKTHKFVKVTVPLFHVHLLECLWPQRGDSLVQSFRLFMIRLSLCDDPSKFIHIQDYSSGTSLDD